MFTSRCTTPPACALAQPRHASLVGRASAARFLVSDTNHRNFTNESTVLPDPMTAHTRLPIARPRHAGQYRLAASWRAPMGAFGSGMQATTDIAGHECGMRMGQPGDRKQGTTEVTCSRTGELGFRALDAGKGGAGSGFRGGAP